MLNTDQFAARNKANLQALSGLATTAFDGFEQLTVLNLQVAKAMFAESAETVLSALSSKDPQALFAFQAGLFQPATEKAAAYGRQVSDIFAASKAEVAKIIAEQTAEAQSSLLAGFEAFAKNAPEGSSGGIALIKSGIAAANNAFDSLQKASDAAEANYTSITGSLVKAAGKAKRA